MDYQVNQSMGFILARTSGRMKSQLAKALKPHNVTTEQWALLVRLWEQDGITQKELADKTLKDQPTITRILDKLEQHGLIIRQSNPEDRRAFSIFLTEQGRAIKKDLLPLALGVLDTALRGFSQEDEERLKSLLFKIIDNLE